MHFQIYVHTLAGLKRDAFYRALLYFQRQALGVKWNKLVARSTYRELPRRSDVFIFCSRHQNVDTMSWVVDLEVIIIEVESRPLLYAKTLPEYSNKIVNNNVWEDIPKKLPDDWETLTNEERNS